MKVKELLEIIWADGWYHVKTKGDHRHYRHPTKPGKVTVSGHLKDDIKPKTLKSMLRQAGLTK